MTTQRPTTREGRSRRAAAKKGAVTRRRNILLAEGFSEDEIDRRRLAQSSFQSRKITQARAIRARDIALEEEVLPPRIADPQQRFAIAASFAQRASADRVFRVERIRLRALESEGFTLAEIDRKRLTTIPFSNRAMRSIRRLRRRQVQRAMQRGLTFNEARDQAVIDTIDELAARELDYPGRLLDLVYA